MCPKPRFSDMVGTKLSPTIPADAQSFYLGLDVSLQTGIACLLDALGQEVCLDGASATTNLELRNWCKRSSTSS